MGILTNLILGSPVNLREELVGLAALWPDPVLVPRLTVPDTAAAATSPTWHREHSWPCTGAALGGQAPLRTVTALSPVRAPSLPCCGSDPAPLCRVVINLQFVFSRCAQGVCAWSTSCFGWHLEPSPCPWLLLMLVYLFIHPIHDLK